MPPANQGYALPEATPIVSPAAPAVRAAAIAASPSSYELPVQPRSLVDQQALPCCVSCALGAAMEVLNPAWPPLSPIFHYHVCRFDRMGADSDGFLFLDSGLVTLSTDGICRDDLHPHTFTAAGAAATPSPEAFEDAKTRALDRRRLRPRFRQVEGPSRVASIREQLRQNCPVVLGIQLPMSYPDTFLDEKFEWADPDSSPRSTSGHCVLVVGYNDARQALHIQDSHGVGKFEKGRWWMKYRVAESTIVHQAYTLLP